MNSSLTVAILALTLGSVSARQDRLFFVSENTTITRVNGTITNTITTTPTCFQVAVADLEATDELMLVPVCPPTDNRKKRELAIDVEPFAESEEIINPAKRYRAEDAGMDDQHKMAQRRNKRFLNPVRRLNKFTEFTVRTEVETVMAPMTATYIINSCTPMGKDTSDACDDPLVASVLVAAPECTDDAGCPMAAMPSCVNGVCKPCGGNDDCVNNAAGPFCNAVTNECGPCVEGSCPGAMVCSADAAMPCVECAGDPDCDGNANGEMCSDAGSCVECKEMGDCATSTNGAMCSAAGSCVECLVPLDCAGNDNGSACIPDDMTCGCTVAADCANSGTGANCNGGPPGVCGT